MSNANVAALTRQGATERRREHYEGSSHEYLIWQTLEEIAENLAVIADELVRANEARSN